MQKGLRRIAGLAVLLTLMLGPVAGSSARVSWNCPPGVKDHHYCSKVPPPSCDPHGRQRHDCRRERD